MSIDFEMLGLPAAQPLTTTDPEPFPEAPEPQGVSFLKDAFDRLRDGASENDKSKVVQTYAEVLVQERLDPVRLRLGILATIIEEIENTPTGPFKLKLMDKADKILAELGDAANREKLSEKGIDLDAKVMVMMGVKLNDDQTQIVEGKVIEETDTGEALEADFTDKEGLVNQFDDGLDYQVDDGEEL